ncbi:SGNH/GDSL hydrolase family protein [uncultured Microscilla sp.]|uniref:SGNH/GDSL hydrolase family protein n=1 Tax=uncultured Microscilla sp. TaxID=432653 RepID=UPI00261754F2|nr:SGNH/GDSL hydrolase family protein [uncultured Microscilla sp.]
MKKTFLLALISFLWCFHQSCQAQTGTQLVAANQNGFYYHGRINFANPKAPEFYWPGTSVDFIFRGSKLLKILLEDEKGKNYFNVILNNQYAKPYLLKCQKGKKKYAVYNNLDAGKSYSVSIFKRTETDEGYTKFMGIELDNGADLAMVKRAYSPRIEFFGNSITVGMGNEDPTGRDNMNPAKKNNYLSYAAITARDLGLDYRCTAKSGIGVMVSWYDLIMPEMYDRVHPDKPALKHDFKSWIPDIVVVNLFQNDSWLVNMTRDPNHKKRFKQGKPTAQQIVKAYMNFISNLRKVYPKAKIVCTLGSMNAVSPGKPWKGYIQQAVNLMKKYYKDQQLYTLFFAYNNRKIGHPTVTDHIKMADQLKKFLKQNILK